MNKVFVILSFIILPGIFMIILGSLTNIFTNQPVFENSLYYFFLGTLIGAVYVGLRLMIKGKLWGS